MDQLPLEFKLYMKGAHVGYECHVKAGYGDICIMHSINGKDWNNVQASNHRKDYYIQHDEKHQWTGLKDKNGEKIYFGDKLEVGENLIVTVILDDGKFICAVNEKGTFCLDTDMFYEMELIK